MRRSALFLAFLIPLSASAQSEVTKDLSPILSALNARALGPVTMGGRITDLAVYEKEPRIYYVASASGGLWKTVNAGITFDPVFENENTISLGAVGVSQSNPDIVWVGTGEDTSRNSVAWGDGVYRSLDGGKTWQNMGLKETMHISKVLVHPKDPNTVYVAALGRLWGENPERGVYKTTDGGKTWQHILKIDDKTGCIDLDFDPKNPNTLIASMWQRRRFAYDFISGGAGSGIYKTTNGGKDWKKITKGLPTSPLGRVGIDYFKSNPKVLVATIEYKPNPEEEKDAKPPRPRDAGTVRNYAGGTFKSADGGESWTRVNFLNPRPFYFSLPTQDPSDESRIYLGSDNLWQSEDGGKTFKTARVNVHPDHHAMWINPQNSHHMILGTDGGVYETHDRGVNWRFLNSMPLGQFYAVAYDMRRPYWVYGGLQDNGSWGIPTQTTKGGISFYDAVMTTYGDGFHVQVDPTNPNTVYSESQGGGIVRTDMAGGPSRSIKPRGEAGERLRFNWSTPFIISSHNPQTLYLGANRLFKSVNRGDSWKAVSPDLTTNDSSKLNPGAKSVTPENTGAEMHCTIITIGESAVKQGLLYVGTDDGLVHVSKDDGATWENIGKNIQGLPANTWCSRVLPSKFVEGRVYATFDGHRNNDFKMYVYVSEDYGQTWTSLANGLPAGDSAYVVAEGEKNPDLLFLGSEMGLRVSLDRGQNWTKFKNSFPTVAVHDLKIHPRELDLIIGTHGRSIYTLDVNGLEGLMKDDLTKDLVVTKPQDVLLLGRVGGRITEGNGIFLARNTQPGTQIQYYLRTPVAGGGIRVTISDASGRATQEFTGTNNAGLNVVEWNGRLGGRMMEPGEYRVVVKAGENEAVTSVRVERATN